MITNISKPDIYNNFKLFKNFQKCFPFLGHLSLTHKNVNKKKEKHAQIVWKFTNSLFLTGPLHIYGPQTVFVSLLNQFGWDGGEKKAHELQEESLNNSTASYPQSPPVHLSEEERSRENDFIFFPSQEQGKECHISKEEVLWGIMGNLYPFFFCTVQLLCGLTDASWVPSIKTLTLAGDFIERSCIRGRPGCVTESMDDKSVA